VVTHYRQYRAIRGTKRWLTRKRELILTPGGDGMYTVISIAIIALLCVLGSVALLILRNLRCLSYIGKFTRWQPRGAKRATVPFFVESIRWHRAIGWYIRDEERVHDIVSCGKLSQVTSYAFLSDVRRGDKVVVLSGIRYGKEDRVTGRGSGKILLRSGTVVHHWEIMRL
jgi:hypothetical protein